ncbi:MAG: hypothetical protein QGH37_18670 [Candidatus Poribacteria bacterium]|jgi:tetratricopeptide (TPR) repeat protein|nr:hypothetical protein [Candidatus Poribacteria bacterium]MDP6997974.1 hypothetical protein [Candidatus Poribacteria bacterium]
MPVNNSPQIRNPIKRYLQHVLLMAFVILTASVQPGMSESLEQKVQQALDIYAQAQESTNKEERMEKFRQAQRLFAYASDQGVKTPALYTNIGTSALQAENLGDAVLAFRRALALDPDHPQALKNLQQSRTLLPKWLPRPTEEGLLDSFFSWHKSMAAGERAGFAALFFLLSAVGFAVSIRWRLVLVRNLSFLPLLLWLVLLGSYIVEINAKSGREAVITVNDTVARVSDSVNSPQRFSQPLPAGAEVQVLEVRGDWARVSLSNGRDAWVGIRSLTYVANS